MRSPSYRWTKWFIEVESKPGEDAVKIVEMTEEDLEYYINLVANAAAGFQRTDFNFGSSTVGGSDIKHPPALPETFVRSLGWEDPLEEGMAMPLQYSCIENPHGQRSLAGYRSWGRKESDMTEWLSTQIVGKYVKRNCLWKEE